MRISNSPLIRSPPLWPTTPKWSNHSADQSHRIRSNPKSQIAQQQTSAALSRCELNQRKSLGSTKLNQTKSHSQLNRTQIEAKSSLERSLLWFTFSILISLKFTLTLARSSKRLKQINLPMQWALRGAHQQSVCQRVIVIVIECALARSN